MRILVMGAALLALASGAGAQEDYGAWRLHTPTFPSTGGGGVIIGEYKPVIAGDKCTTDFTATLPDGNVYHNSVEFDAVSGARRNAVHEWTLALQGWQRERDHAVSGVLPGWRGARFAISHPIVPRAPQHRRRCAAFAPPRSDALSKPDLRPADSRRGNRAARGQTMMEKRFWSGAIAVVTLIVAGAGALPELLLRPASTGPSVALPRNAPKAEPIAPPEQMRS